MVRVATLNLLNNPHGRWDDRAELVIDQAREVDADLYAFQEVAADTDQVERLRAGLGEEFAAVSLPNPDRSSIKSLAIVTRLPIVDETSCTDLPAGDLALRVDVDVPGGPIMSIATTHLLFAPSKRGSDVRRAQAERLVAWLDDALEPTVLLGDFNSRDSGGAVTFLKQHFRSAHGHVHGREPDVTHPTPLVHALDVEKAYGLPVFPEGEGAAVDYVFVRGQVDIAACAVAWDLPSASEPNLYPSDHFGLVADLRVG
jgi:endonuclease/exonuclease/phosphatase family metal-dependent hydrolase